jgi:hypothetical protein
MEKCFRVWPYVCLVILCLTSVLFLSSVAYAKDDKDDNNDKDKYSSRVRRGFAIAPVPLNLKGKNRALVGLGSYIVNAQGGCNDCHTHPSYLATGDPFKGLPEQINAAQYLSGGRQFGPFTSANITPDANGRPAGLTFNEFRSLLRTGHDPDDPPGVLLQVMPWPVYGKMVDRDLRAIYEFLSAIPSLPNNPNPGP